MCDQRLCRVLSVRSVSCEKNYNFLLQRILHSRIGRDVTMMTCELCENLYHFQITIIYSATVPLPCISVGNVWFKWTIKYAKWCTIFNSKIMVIATVFTVIQSTYIWHSAFTIILYIVCVLLLLPFWLLAHCIHLFHLNHNSLLMLEFWYFVTIR